MVLVVYMKEILIVYMKDDNMKDVKGTYVDGFFCRLGEDGHSSPITSSSSSASES